MTQEEMFTDEVMFQCFIQVTSETQRRFTDRSSPVCSSESIYSYGTTEQKQLGIIPHSEPKLVFFRWTTQERIGTLSCFNTFCSQRIKLVAKTRSNTLSWKSVLLTLA